MKKFTVKDFLKLNSPCYGCGKKVNVYVCTVSTANEVKLNLVVSPAGYLVILSKTYNDRLTLLIEPKTNKFATNDGPKLIKYLKSRGIFLSVECNDCMTVMTSEPLEFNFVGEYIKPVGMASQSVVLKDKNNNYVIYSDFGADRTHISIFSIKEGSPTSFSQLELPLLPHYRFKDQQHFMSKIKTYMLFS